MKVCKCAKVIAKVSKFTQVKVKKIKEEDKIQCWVGLFHKCQLTKMTKNRRYKQISENMKILILLSNNIQY